MKTSEVIKAAYKLIHKPENWTRGEAARDAFRQPVPPDSPDAVCFCLLGALDRVAPDTRNSAFRLLSEDALARGHGSVHGANDVSTHDAVLRAFRRVYRKTKQLESEGKI